MPSREDARGVHASKKKNKDVKEHGVFLLYQLIKVNQVLANAARRGKIFIFREKSVFPSPMKAQALKSINSINDVHDSE